jgi:DNA polymerase
MSGVRHDDPRALLASYLTQLAEAGEKDICLSAETVALVRGAAPSQGGESGAAQTLGKPHASQEQSVSRGSGVPRDPVAEKLRDSGGPVAEKPRRPAGPVGEKPRETESSQRLSVREKAALLPELEPIAVRLALGPGTAAPDMFVEASHLESCMCLDEVERISLACEKCELAGTRINVVFGAGDENADLMFVGEAPGANEDREGIPFIGRAGALLDKIIEAAGFRREDVYISNILKCRPPNNRTPLSSEIDACVPFLAKQIEIIAPRIICTLGLPATHTLLGVRGSMGSLRGKIYAQDNLKVIPTYHPAAALRDPKYKRPMWEDFLRIRKEYDKL